jgi:hypothetical protein
LYWAVLIIFLSLHRIGKGSSPAIVNLDAGDEISFGGKDIEVQSIPTRVMQMSFASLPTMNGSLISTVTFTL